MEKKLHFRNKDYEVYDPAQNPIQSAPQLLGHVCVLRELSWWPSEGQLQTRGAWVCIRDDAADG